MSLKSKLGTLRTGVLATGLGLAGLTGCAEFEEFEDALFEQVIYEGAASKLEERGEYERARSVRRIGDAMTGIRIAKAGRSDINVNVDTNTNENRRRQQLPENVILLSNGNYSPAQGYTWINPKDNNDVKVRKITNDIKQSIVDEDFKSGIGIFVGQFYYFAANYWKDFDGDGHSSPDEFVGIKKRFRDDEKLTLSSYDQRPSLRGSQAKIEVYSPDGEIIHTTEIAYEGGAGRIITINAHITTATENSESKSIPLMTFLFEKGGYGNYKAIWKLDGKYDGSNEFEIIPSLRK